MHHRQEKELRRVERAKQRARRARNRFVVAGTARTNNNIKIVKNEIDVDNMSHPSASTSTSMDYRFQWQEAPWFVYANSSAALVEETCCLDWKQGSLEKEEEHQPHSIQPRNDDDNDDELVVVTWNVLFDLFDPKGLKGATGEESDSNGEDAVNRAHHIARWKKLCSILSTTNADLISLQEVTPDFVRVLCGCDWVRSDYACSASPYQLGSVSRSGVMLLWRRSTMLPYSSSVDFKKKQSLTRSDSALYRCVDAGRSRSLIATLVPRKRNRSNRQQQQEVVVTFAVCHLPADKSSNTGGTEHHNTKSSNSCHDPPISRTLARKRELGSILGQIERLGSGVGGTARMVVPVVAGDFNIQDDELFDGYFSSGNKDTTTATRSLLYRDVWTMLVGDTYNSKDNNGCGWTWDPNVNPRASRSCGLIGAVDSQRRQPKRIDRIFIGPTATETSFADPMSVELLLGRSNNDANDDLPPSDHFGVRSVLRLWGSRKEDYSNQEKKERKSVTVLERSLFASNSPPSNHYLLAAVVMNRKLEHLKSRHDPNSSLPLLHITLLHGFVEADYGCLDLVKTFVRQAIRAATVAVSSSTDESPGHLTFSTPDALDVFEHRESATLVARPDKHCSGTQGLYRRYEALRVQFRSCDGQERHSVRGWRPHGKCWRGKHTKGERFNIALFVSFQLN